MATTTMTAVTISVGTETVDREEFTMHWLVDQLRRQSCHCVRVSIDLPDANLLLKSGGCPANPWGGSRLPNRKERAIFELWDERGMNDVSWAPGNLNAFLQQLRRLL